MKGGEKKNERLKCILSRNNAFCPVKAEIRESGPLGTKLAKERIRARRIGPLAAEPPFDLRDCGRSQENRAGDRRRSLYSTRLFWERQIVEPGSDKVSGNERFDMVR